MTTILPVPDQSVFDHCDQERLKCVNCRADNANLMLAFERFCNEQCFAMNMLYKSVHLNVPQDNIVPQASTPPHRARVLRCPPPVKRRP